LARKHQEELKRKRHPRHFVQWFSDVEFYFSNQCLQQFANDAAGLLDASYHDDKVINKTR